MYLRGLELGYLRRSLGFSSFTSIVTLSSATANLPCPGFLFQFFPGLSWGILSLEDHWICEAVNTIYWLWKNQNVSNTWPISIKLSFIESLRNYLAFRSKNKIVDLLSWQQQIIHSQTYKSVRSTLVVWSCKWKKFLRKSLVFLIVLNSN